MSMNKSVELSGKNVYFLIVWKITVWLMKKALKI